MRFPIENMTSGGCARVETDPPSRGVTGQSVKAAEAFLPALAKAGYPASAQSGGGR